MDQTIERIAQLIEARGTNPSALSLELGMGRQYVRDILAGKSKSPSLEGVTRIAKALGCSVAYLAGEIDDPLLDTPIPPTGVCISLDTERADELSHGLSDLLCWCRGFRAALGDEHPDREPFGDWAAREINIILKSRLEKANIR